MAFRASAHQANWIACAYLVAAKAAVDDVRDGSGGTGWDLVPLVPLTGTNEDVSDSNGRRDFATTVGDLSESTGGIVTDPYPRLAIKVDGALSGARASFPTLVPGTVSGIQSPFVWFFGDELGESKALGPDTADPPQLVRCTAAETVTLDVSSLPAGAALQRWTVYHDDATAPDVTERTGVNVGDGFDLAGSTGEGLYVVRCDIYNSATPGELDLLSSDSVLVQVLDAKSGDGAISSVTVA